MLLKLNLARNSLRYIIRTYDIEEIYMPYYICPVMRQAVLKEGCKPKFYHIDDSFMPTETFSEQDYILYPNYFGICDENVNKLVVKYPKLIIDNAHAFYSEPKGFACFNSVRKFLPVYFGSYLWINKSSIKLPCKESPLQYNLKFENDFEKEEMALISIKLEKYIESFDLKKIRKEKFLKFHEKYGKYNCLTIGQCESPFCYPFLANTNKEADDFVNELEKTGMIIYRYWNNLPIDFIEYKFYKRLVPIPLN